jgi:hypothetical protein
MEMQRNEIKAVTDSKIRQNNSSVHKFGHDVKNINEKKDLLKEVETIKLEPEQIEEIHADEYSLTLFYATRMQPMSLLEIKRQFAEPEAKKAQSVMDRFLKAGLIHVTREGKYYSNFPEGYINYADYRYDSDLEARKDAKVFQIMKEQTGKRDYWKDQTYFSIDAFYSEEQSKELIGLFREIKLKAKKYSNENSKSKSIKGLKFRRMKFYDMMLSLFLVFLFTVGTSFPSYAGGGGNDPTGMQRFASGYRFDSIIYLADASTLNGGGGHDPEDTPRGGGGHDPEDGGFEGRRSVDPISNFDSCWINIDGKLEFIQDRKTCILNRFTQLLNGCDKLGEASCNYLLQELERLIEDFEAVR